MKNEFSRIRNLAEMVEGSKKVKIEATKAECQALAKRFGLLGLGNLKAVLAVASEGPGVFEVTGQLSADVTQACVRSLEPVKSKVAEAFSTTYMEEAVFAAMDDEERDDQVEDIEVLEGEEVDLGELTAQYLSLGLDPYPVAEDAKAGSAHGDGVQVISEQEAKEQKSPFAKLKKLHKKG